VSGIGYLVFMTPSFLSKQSKPDTMASTCESIVEFVRLGLGVGFIHDFCLRTQTDKALSCSAMAGQFGGLEVSLVYRKSAAAKPAHQALINALVKSCFAVSKVSTLGNRIARPRDRT
jgi:DNA-binding transcriptional LysR family regulator